MPRIKLNSLLDDAKQALEPAETPRELITEPVLPPVEERSTVAAIAPSPEPAKSEPVTTLGDPAPAEAAAPTPTLSRPPRRAAPRRQTEPTEPARVHYATLIRKEARLRDDQIESLTLRARRLSRNKAVTDQRITDNTLIRIAVDLLLAKENELSGTSEAELRKSVGL